MGQFIQYIKNRLHNQNKNFICAVVGPTGSGKSYSGLRLCEQVDSDFNIDQVAFTPQEFMDLLNSGKLKRGSAILFDEAGVAINSRNFQTKTNKCLNFIAQTFRSNNYCVVYSMPDFGFLDAAIRKLCHCLLETKKIDYEREVVWLKPLMVENNARYGRVYLKYPRIRDKGNPRTVTAVTKMYFHKPTDGLIEAYEAKKAQYNKDLQADVQASLRGKDSPSTSREEKAMEEMRTIYEAVRADEKRYMTSSGALNEGAVTMDYGIGVRKMNRLKQLILSGELPPSKHKSSTERTGKQG